VVFSDLTGVEPFDLVTVWQRRAQTSDYAVDAANASMPLIKTSKRIE